MNAADPAVRNYLLAEMANCSEAVLVAELAFYRHSIKHMTTGRDCHRHNRDAARQVALAHAGNLAEFCDDLSDMGQKGIADDACKELRKRVGKGRLKIAVELSSYGLEVPADIPIACAGVAPWVRSEVA